jgi:hypothetical protein
MNSIGTLQTKVEQLESEAPFNSKNSIEQKVNILKNEIEYISKLNKGQITNEEHKENVNLKQRKMSELKKLNEDLKLIYKKEKLEQTKRNQLISIQRTMDNLDFRAAKKRNNSEAMDNAKKAKEQRELLRKTYLESQEIEKKYLEIDSKIVPGNLFLHEDVIKKYGLCPFINVKENEIGKEIEKKRLEWLESTDDKGELYYNLYKDFYENTIINSLLKEKQKIEDSIEEFIKKSLSPSQNEIYNDSVSLLQDYIKCNIKSKRIKERYKNFVNNMSILYSETSFTLHNYLSLKYNIPIIVNIINKNENKLNKQEKMVKIISIEEFENLVEEFSKIDKSLEQKSKFNMNIIKNINSNLYYYLTNNQEFLKTVSINKKQNDIFTQKGKYFKRWILLSNDEKLERFYSFSEFFVKKCGCDNNLIEKLYNLLKNDFLEKRIVYRDYIWNVKSGIIENVKILRYDKEKEDFILKYTTSKKKESSKESSKKVSTKTIITKNIEKIINEELLYFIVKKLKNNKETETEVKNKEEFFDHIKEKLSVKKINKTDKEIINKTYDNIYLIIKNNKLN